MKTRVASIVTLLTLVLLGILLAHGCSVLAEKENEDYILDKYFDGKIPVEVHEKILCYQILWDYLWAQWTVIKEAKGDDFGSYGRDRFNRAKANLKRINQ